LNDLLAIEQVSFPCPWSETSFLAEFKKYPPSLYVARENKNKLLLGYICFWSVADEIHLLNLAVRPNQRHQGVGRRLMQFLLEQARINKAQAVFLEVRPSNLPALDLYSSLGFKVLYRRPGYYGPDGEDALIMCRSAAKRQEPGH
jgi:[ribosomal protein S18]-alanine N-acetyltransferase